MIVPRASATAFFANLTIGSTGLAGELEVVTSARHRRRTSALAPPPRLLHGRLPLTLARCAACVRSGYGADSPARIAFPPAGTEMPGFFWGPADVRPKRNRS
jgi:hypothetical protein